jgi:two-component system, NarL family, invasion response regulator UvrY
VSMPDVDGFIVAREIRTFLPEVPMLILSMHDGHNISRQAQQVGVRGFVSKSAAGQMLLKAVELVLHGQNNFPALNV